MSIEKCHDNNKTPLDIALNMTYNSHRNNKEVNKMAGKKKNGGKDKTLQILVFATAILNLVKSLIDLIERLTK